MRSDQEVDEKASWTAPARSSPSIGIGRKPPSGFAPDLFVKEAVPEILDTFSRASRSHFPIVRHDGLPYK
jgi:hypothetical protein